jgi:hypothetical protein
MLKSASRAFSYSASEQILLLKQTIHRITIGKRELTIVFSRTGLREIIHPADPKYQMDEPHAQHDEVVIKKSVYMKRCGIETKLIVSEETTAPAHPETVQAIQKALAKALAWNEGLVSGEIESMKAIAEQENILTYVISRREGNYLMSKSANQLILQ